MTIRLCHTHSSNDKHCAANIDRQCLRPAYPKVCSPWKSVGVLVICCCIVAQAVCYFIYSGCMGQGAGTSILHLLCEFCTLHSQLLAPEDKDATQEHEVYNLLGRQTQHSLQPGKGDITGQ